MEKVEVVDVTIAERVTTPTSFRTSEVSIVGKVEAAKGTATPDSFRRRKGHSRRGH